MADRTVSISQSARDDLRQLLIYLVDSGSSVPTARRFVAGIETQCRTLSHFPHRGLQRSDIRPGLRLLALDRRSVVAYVIEAETIIVTNIFHAGQDFEALLRDA